MTERTLRKRCRSILRELGITAPLRVPELCRLLGEHRGRPIRLVPYSLPVPGPYGLWIAGAQADFIFYQKETSQAHQDHIVLHEVGHILADHGSDESEDAVWQEVLPDLSIEVINRALRRTSYAEEREREAELVATIILEWASVLDRVTPRAPGDISARRVHTALADRQGWL
ncbi:MULTISPECIES: hypothetical protein [unclassified Streptomyces]|uniref:hypothetical protein n=1 Tax=unclassified Streptomyces TaxID=2593676 RepID=UPI001FAF5951|nr:MULTISPECIES: hypothetical protein [unclassified Streptomyces]MCJ0873281.1 hypothetical protein [Streptomyces sp. AP-93]MCP3759111.1 hypothetical protein [Streptomyces sp. TBY4]